MNDENRTPLPFVEDRDTGPVIRGHVQGSEETFHQIRRGTLAYPASAVPQQALRGQSLVVAVAQFRPHFASGAALSSAGRGPGLFSRQLRRPTQASGHRSRDRRDERLIPLGGSRRNSSPSIGAELKRRRVGAPLSLGLPRRTATIVRSGPARRSTQGLSHVHSGPTRRPTTPFSIRRTLQL